MLLYVLFTTSCQKQTLEPDCKKRIVSIVINKSENDKPATTEVITEMILMVARQTAFTGGGIVIIVPVVNSNTSASPFLLSIRRMDPIIPYKSKDGLDSYSRADVTHYSDSLRPFVKNYITKYPIGSKSAADFTRALLICRNFTDAHARLNNIHKKTVIGTDDYSNYLTTVNDESILPIFSGNYDFWQYETKVAKGKHNISFRKKKGPSDIPIESIIH